MGSAGPVQSSGSFANFVSYGPEGRGSLVVYAPFIFLLFTFPFFRGVSLQGCFLPVRLVLLRGVPTISLRFLRVRASFHRCTNLRPLSQRVSRRWERAWATPCCLGETTPTVSGVRALCGRRPRLLRRVPIFLCFSRTLSVHL